MTETEMEELLKILNCSVSILWGVFFTYHRFDQLPGCMASMPGGELRQRILAVEMLLCIEPRVC